MVSMNRCILAWSSWARRGKEFAAAGTGTGGVGAADCRRALFARQRLRLRRFLSAAGRAAEEGAAAGDDDDEEEEVDDVEVPGGGALRASSQPGGMYSRKTWPSLRPRPSGA